MGGINLGGIIHFSTIDWRGKAAMVIFLRGCPFRCVYCQNYNLIEGEDNYVEMSEIEEAIRESEPFIDAVVISGGEPFMQPHAVDAISKYAHQRALLVGVQTNGYYPEVMESLLDTVDKVFLDIKAPLTPGSSVYGELTKLPSHIVTERVGKTLELLLARGIDTEVVTTVFKKLVGAAEVRQIAEELCDMGAAECPYVIQQGRIERIPRDACLGEANVFSYEELKELASIVHRSSSLREVRIRTRERGEEVIYNTR